MRLAIVLLLVLAGCLPVQTAGPTRAERSLELKSTKPLKSLEEKPMKSAIPSPTPATGGTSFTGSGTNTTEVFEAPLGDYLVSWTVSGGSDCFYTIDLEPIGHDELVALPAAGTTPATGSATQRLDGGQYAFDVTSECDWTVSIEPR